MKLRLLVAAAVSLHAQEMAFEVASIKPAGEDARYADVNGVNRQVGGITTFGGGPGSPTPRQMNGQNVDVRFLLMLQHLLRERFGLRYHTEPRQRPVWVVTIGRGGVKFQESATGAPLDPDAPKAPPKIDEEGYPTFAPGVSNMGMMARGDGRLRLSAQRFKVGDLLKALENYLGRPVVDETGLTGEYDFRFAFGMAGRPGPVSDDPPPTAREALEALGFRIEGGERPVDAVVIDAVNANPTEN